MRDSDDAYLTGYTVIIDDLLFRSTSTSLLLFLLEFYFRVYFKYRTTLNVLKCDFLRKQFEFVRNNTLPNGITTTLITDWPYPPNGESLRSFICLCNIYNKIILLFELKVTPLRMLYIKYIQNNIPSTT